MGVRAGESHAPLLLANYYRVPANLYRPGDVIEEDLYFLYQGNYLLYRLKNLIWKEEDAQKLHDFKLEHLYIKLPSERAHHRFIESRLKRLLEEAQIADSEKAEMVYATSQSILEELFEKPQSPETIRRSMNSVQNSITFLSKNRENFFELMRLAKNHFAEFTHGVHVAAYAITLAKQLGVKSFNHISAIGIAGILHDIGKTRISKSLLEKSEPLTESERLEIEKHPIYSFEILKQSGMVPGLVELITLQHHERKDGSGYPHKVSNELHLYSRILALADCFDCLTSNRTHQKALSPLEAIEWLRTKGQEAYDQHLVLEFIKMLKR